MGEKALSEANKNKRKMKIGWRVVKHYCIDVFTAITHMVVVLPAPLWPRNDVICPS